MEPKKINGSSKVTKSYNSYSGRGVKKNRILKVLRENQRPLSPKEISFLAKLNHSTTRVYLRRLLEKGKVVQPYPQAYVSKPRDSRGEGLTRVHNLVFSVEAPGLARGLRTFEDWFGSVKVRVLFGCKRGKITGFVSCDGGLDLNGFCFAVDKFKSVISDRTGARVSDGEIRVVTCELNEDAQGIRMDGITCFTVRDFRGFLERVYNKDDGVRNEVKVQPQSVEHIMALLKGGLTTFQIAQGQALTNKKLDNLTDTIKQTNGFLIQILDALKGGK